MYQPNYERIANTVINTNLDVQPGQEVVIHSRADTIALAELLARAALHREALPTILLRSDDMLISEIMETPLTQLPQAVVPQVEATARADHNITLGVLYTDPRRFRVSVVERARLYRQRLAAIDQVRQAGGGGKWLEIGYPTRQLADALSIPWLTFYEQFWQAVDADYEDLHQRAAWLETTLNAGQTLHISTPLGTDLEVRRGNRPIFCDTGTVESFGDLPAGEVGFAPLETSVQGRVVVDSTRYQGCHAVGLELMFDDGIMTPRRATQGFDSFMTVWDRFDEGRRHLADVGIGINSAVYAVTGYAPMDVKVAGSCHIALGDNILMGGKITSNLHWDMVLLQPTVTVDGTVILKNGRFVQ